MFIELFIDIAHRVNTSALLPSRAERIVIGCVPACITDSYGSGRSFYVFGLAAHQEAAQRVNQRLAAHPVQGL
ncbi:Uncharacterised protein [Klebsiella pneumoniae]|uniref:Uncharacterized protein n=1 Tax=Klebsiella pneumoniae TaxID=573 RepID=A0A377XRM1_KLEPN|nr:Uncharacterised protein [Klebsiella pneumoniae]